MGTPGEGSPPAAELLDLVLATLTPTTAPRVAVLAPGADHRFGPRLARAAPRSRVTTVALDAGLDTAHTDLTAHGPYDVVVDLGGAQQARQRLEQLFFHVAPGGSYVSRLARGQAGDVARSDLAAWVAEVAAIGPDSPRFPPSRRARSLVRLAESVTDVRTTPLALVVGNTVRTVPKIVDAEHDRLLELHPEAGRVLEVVPAQEAVPSYATTPGAPAVSPERAAATPLAPAPRLSLREHEQVTCLPRQGVLTEQFVLSESFRKVRRRSPRNRHALPDWTERFVRPPEPPAQTLSGTWFHLDPEIPAHFGHAVSEQLSHLWGWEAAKARYPELRALVFSDAPLHPWQTDLLAAAGVAGDDLRVQREPVVVERLVTTTAGYSIGDYLHPVMAQLYDAVGARLAAQVTVEQGPVEQGPLEIGPVEMGPVEMGPARLFLTRHQDKRACTNRAEVEQHVAARGFSVVRPELLPLAEQVRLVRGADVVAGFAGSVLMHLALAGAPKRVIALMPDTYHADNERQIAALLGHRLDLVVSRADQPRTTRGFDGAAYRSSFRVDLDPGSSDLDRVLDDLGDA